MKVQKSIEQLKPGVLVSTLDRLREYCRYVHVDRDMLKLPTSASCSR